MDNKSLPMDYYRKKTWIANAIRKYFYKCSKKKRDTMLWTFGCWEGQRYDDSSRYLFEFINRNYKNIKAVWITSSNSVYEELLNKKLPVAKSGTIEGIRLMKKCGFAFYSNGLDDFGNNYFLEGAVKINLNHGAGGIKDIKYFDFEKQKGIKSFLKKIKHDIFNVFEFDYTVTTSEFSKRFWMRAFCDYKEDKYLVLGLPRNDVLLKDINFDIENKDCKYICYMPTYRNYDNSVIADFIHYIIGSSRINDFLHENKYKILIKPHYAEMESLRLIELNDNIMLLDKNTTISTQELLKISDVLITDYSCCSFDFAIQDKPVIFYVPDFDEYNSKCGIYKPFEEFYVNKFICKSMNELWKSINNIINGGQNDTSATPILRNKYMTMPLEGETFSSMLLKFLFKKYQIKGEKNK